MDILGAILYKGRGYMDMDISMDIHAKSLDMDMDMDGKFHIHGNPVNSRTRTVFQCVRPSSYTYR